MLDVINLAGELRQSIKTGNQIHFCLALQWDETKDEKPLEKRFGKRHENRRQGWWLSPDDRNWPPDDVSANGADEMTPTVHGQGLLDRDDRRPPGAACKTRMPRETSMAASVRCSAWFGVLFHIPERDYFCQKPCSMPPWIQMAKVPCPGIFIGGWAITPPAFTAAATAASMSSTSQ